MPRSSALVSPTPLGADAVAAAVSAVRERLHRSGSSPDFTLQPLDGGAALTVRAAEDLVLTLLRPRPLADAAEVERLRPGMPSDGLPLPGFWSDAYTPWTAAGLIGVAVLDALAEASGARVDHDTVH